MRQAPDPAGSPIGFLQQVQREERLADKVAGLLKHAILSGQLKPGDRLPPERILGERFGVSRTVVREAVRSLAAKGLVDVRSGSGSVIARVDSGAVTETIQLYLKSAEIGERHVDEIRDLLEIHVAGLAAERATDADVKEMRRALQAMKSAETPQERAAGGEEFHRGLARATRNPLYLVVLEAIGEPVAAARAGSLAVAGGAARAIQAHARILERIAMHDPDGARMEMRLHLDDSRRDRERAANAARHG